MTWNPKEEYEKIKHRLRTDKTFREQYDDGVSRFDERQIEAIASYLAVATPILDELARHGYVVRSIGSLGLHYPHFESAIPLLIDWARRLEPGPVWSDILRAISKPWAKDTVGPFLVSLYPLTQPKSRSVVASCLALVASQEIEADLVRLVEVAKQDEVWCRERMLDALATLKTPIAEKTILGFRADAEEPVRLIVAKSLAKFPSPAAVDALRELARDQKRDVAKMAQASLKKIEKKATKEGAKSRKH